MQFHSDDYVRFLERITPETAGEAGKLLQRFNIGEDCPVIEGLFELCQIAAGGSIAGAIKLNSGQAECAVNWAGGLHHAKRGEPSGFCYVNDIVLAILELLKQHARVLYIDIDVHHGDGVEEAFYTTDRVMTVSFHKYGEFFPGTGALNDIGIGRGKRYSVNVPLRDGIDDVSYASIFEPIIGHVMEWYRPGAIVLQCGADSLAGDRLGGFNLSNKGHAACLQFVQRYNLPLMVLGGGGYTIRNVARCWAYETALCIGGSPLAEEIPFNDYHDYYGPDYTITVPSNNMTNLNTPPFLNKLRERIIDTMRHLQHAPSVQSHSVPGAFFQEPEIESEDSDVPKEDEFSEFFALEALHRRRASLLNRQISIMEPMEGLVNGIGNEAKLTSESKDSDLISNTTKDSKKISGDEQQDEFANHSESAISMADMLTAKEEEVPALATSL